LLSTDIAAARRCFLSPPLRRHYAAIFSFMPLRRHASLMLLAMPAFVLPCLMLAFSRAAASAVCRLPRDAAVCHAMFAASAPLTTLLLSYAFALLPDFHWPATH
jgi:hypothetical protein